jgi:hypothetical protein
MRPIATVLLLGLAVAAGAAEVWRWKDADGVVHYSDQPRPGAERVIIGEAPKPSGTGPPPPPPAVARREPRPAPFSYARCEVVSPAADETLHGVQQVTVTLAVEPALRTGHRVEVLMNGAAIPGWPPELTRYTIPEVFRGSHTLQVRIYDENGVEVCSGPSLTFHLRQTSVLAPGRGVRIQPAPAGR